MTSHCPEPPNRQSASKIDPSSVRRHPHCADRRPSGTLVLWQQRGGRLRTITSCAADTPLQLPRKRRHSRTRSLPCGYAYVRRVPVFQAVSGGASRQQSSPFVTVVTVLPLRLRGFVRQHAAICVMRNGIRRATGSTARYAPSRRDWTARAYGFPTG